MKKLISAFATGANNMLYRERVRTAIFTRLTNEGADRTTSARLAKSCVATWSDLIDNRDRDFEDSPNQMATTVTGKEMGRMVMARRAGSVSPADSPRDQELLDRAHMQMSRW